MQYMHLKKYNLRASAKDTPKNASFQKIKIFLLYFKLLFINYLNYYRIN